MFFVVGLGLSRGNFGDGLILGEPHGNVESALLDDALAEFVGQLEAAEESVHAGEVDVEFIDGSFFKKGNTFSNDFSDFLRFLAVFFKVSAHDNRFRTELPSGTHGHGGVYAKFPCFVAARGDDTSVTCPSNEDRLSLEAVVKKPLYGHKKGIQIQVHDTSLFFHENC